LGKGITLLDGPSRTALSAALYRAEHQLLDHGALFADALAVPLLGFTADELDQQARRDDRSRRMRAFIAGRSRFAEERARAAVLAGVDQVVILGAGLDTFAYRLDRAGQPVVAYEVDHPATQRWKREQLARAGVIPGERVRSVPVDLEREELLPALAGHGFDPARPAFVLWLGVLPYLTLAAVEATLRAVASVPGAQLVFDYGEPVGVRGGEDAEAHRERADRVAALGEPWLTFLTPAELVAVLGRNGLRLLEDVDAAAWIRRALGVPQPEGRRSAAHYAHAISLRR
jgi:methyltransferase (TIGR00027 family)